MGKDRLAFSWILTAILTILFSTIIACEAAMFDRIVGFRINTTFWDTTLSIGDQKLCCYLCVSTDGCKAVNYNSETKQCERSAETPYYGNVGVYETSHWDIYLIQTTGKYF